MRTVKEVQVLELEFPMDYQPLHWKVKPGHFLAHFIGHEGAGSLHSYLKDKSWITSLSAGATDQARGITTFRITIRVTRAGLSKSSNFIG